MNISKEPVKVALADDHSLLRSALADLIDGFGDCRVIHHSGNGQELIDAIISGERPDIVILDLNMPKLNGFQTAQWLYKNHPEINVLLLSMFDSELSLIRLLQYGVKGFLKKDISPTELRFAIQSVMQLGFYHSHSTTGKIVSLFRNSEGNHLNLQKSMLSEQEFSFLQFACSDLTYKEIAQKMGLNPRSVDTLRDQLFVKLDVRSRVGLALLAMRHGIVTL